MNFDELHAMIPLARYGKEKVLTMKPYPNITLAMPGRHAEDTTPKGGDFVVMVTDEAMHWRTHQFTHTDIFKVIQAKYDIQPNPTTFLMKDYLTVILGGEIPYPPTNYSGVTLMANYIVTMEETTFLQAVQCLAVAEHRRYAKHEAKWGGRFLPFRFAAGIAEGLWTATDAADKQKRGRPGVEWLEKDYGTPTLTKELINGT